MRSCLVGFLCFFWCSFSNAQKKPVAFPSKDIYVSTDSSRTFVRIVNDSLLHTSLFLLKDTAHYKISGDTVYMWIDFLHIGTMEEGMRRIVKGYIMHLYNRDSFSLRNPFHNPHRIPDKSFPAILHFYNSSNIPLVHKFRYFTYRVETKYDYEYIDVTRRGRVTIKHFDFNAAGRGEKKYVRRLSKQQMKEWLTYLSLFHHFLQEQRQPKWDTSFTSLLHYSVNGIEINEKNIFPFGVGSIVINYLKQIGYR